MNDRILLSPPHMSGRELDLIHQTFATNFIAPAGPNLEAFEHSVCTFTGAKHALAVSSGTAAIHLALASLGISKGDIVLCQSLTFVGSANPILYQGATPVFIDSEPESWNMCPDALETAIKHFAAQGKRPAAVIAVHLYGMPFSADIIRICERFVIPLIEDAAESLGSTLDGRQTGTFGTASILSFNGNKIITASTGGMLLSADQQVIERARKLATQAKESELHYEHQEPGYNYRMSSVVAAIGLGQMTVLAERVRQRKHIFECYKELLKNTPVAFQTGPPEASSNRWLTAILLEEPCSHEKIGEMIRSMDKHDIECRHVWKPMHLQPLFRDAVHFGSKVAERLFERGLCLPSGSAMGEKDIARVTSTLRTLL